MGITLSSMSQLLRHLAGHFKAKKKPDDSAEYGVPGMRGHSHGPLGVAKVKTPKQQRVGFHKVPKIKAPGMNKFGVHSKSVHASANGKTKKREAAAARIREYIPEKPAGSWERISQFIAQAAQEGDEFGGPVDDKAPYSDSALRSWDINVWASFPNKSAVIIANEKSGKLWFANYALKDGEVTFSNVKPVVLSVKATEAMRRRRYAAEAIIAGLREAGAKNKQIIIRSGVVVFGKCVEGMHIAGSAEETVGAISPRVSKIRKHVKVLGRLVSQSPCPCGNATHRPKLIASFPESKTLVTDCESGMHSVPYGTKGGAFALGTPTKVKAKLVPVKSARESRRAAARIRESGAAAPAKATLTFVARIREAKVDKDGAHADCVMLEEGPGNEADGHYYPSKTINECIESGIFEGKQTFADHPSPLEDKTGSVRSIRDLIGWWSDVHAEEAAGKVLMCGTYNIETGNDFALNKMREAQKYKEKYPDKPGYVGFSINAGGVSEPQEIDGKNYNVVTRITEAVSTDMVSLAGAGGKMLNLKEVAKVAKALKLEPAAQKVLEQIVEAAYKKHRENDVASAKLRAKEVKKMLESAGFTLSDEQDKALDKALGLVDGGVLDKAIDAATGVAGGDDAEDPDGDTGDEEDEDMGIESLDGGDDELDGAPAKVADDEDEPVEGDKKREAAAKKRRDALVERNAVLEKTVKKLQMREAVRSAKRVADKLAEELKVPAAARAYFVQELLEVESGPNVETKMRERAKALIEFIGSVASSGSGVDGVPAREAASGSGSALIKI